MKIDEILKRMRVAIIPEIECDSALTFHENTKLTKQNSRPYGEYIEWLVGEKYFVERMMNAYKVYPTAPRIDLPKDLQSLTVEFERVIQTRRSLRNFDGRSMNLNDLSKILLNSYGITGSIAIPHHPSMVQHLRATPSAGALYPLEIYLAIFRVKDLQKGLYHYNVESHLLEFLKGGIFAKKIGELCFVEPFVKIKKSCLVLILSAVFNRTLFKYQDRGYRFILMEAGHLAQNVSLVCHAMGLGSVLIGGFLDDEMNQLLDLDGRYESVIYPIIIGRRDE